jgi:oxygen-independent coproporphyrinogen-3 oxidase
MEIKSKSDCTDEIKDIIDDYPELKREFGNYTFFVKAKAASGEKNDYRDFVSSVRNVLSDEKKMSLYFHYPFCNNNCTFCHYFKYHKTTKPIETETVRLLLDEINIFRKLLKTGEMEVSSLYLGGGTPSLMELDELDDFMSMVNKSFIFQDNTENTIEAAIEDICDNTLEFYSKYFNRISIGVQSLHETVLKSNKRFSHIDFIKDRIKLLRKRPKKMKVNLDMMYGFPSQTFTSICEDIERILDLFPEVNSFTFYRLRLKGQERKSLLHSFYSNHKTVFPSQAALCHQKLMISKKMMELGFKEKPIGWYSKDGASKTYTDRWFERVPLLGFGLSAYSIVRNFQKTNFCSLRRTQRAIENKSLPIDSVVCISDINAYNIAYRLKYDGVIQKHMMPPGFLEKLSKDKRIFNDDCNSYTLTSLGILFVEEIIDSFLKGGKCE